MGFKPEEFKKSDGTIDWGRFAQARLKEIEEKEKTKEIKKSKSPGGYKNLIVYQQAVMIYDLTVEFCKRFLNSIKEGRTIEQMVQAARSGKQNIVEGSLEKSLKMNIKLTGVARASFGELLEDYKDFLRTRNLVLWDKNDSRVREIRSWRIGHGSNGTNGSNGSNWTNRSNWTNSPERFANLMITLISKENYLLDKMIHSLEEKFVRQGGYSEQLRQRREKERKRRIWSN
jgi:four helix bundle suffix protein